MYTLHSLGPRHAPRILLTSNNVSSYLVHLRTYCTFTGVRAKKMTKFAAYTRSIAGIESVGRSPCTKFPTEYVARMVKTVRSSLMSNKVRCSTSTSLDRESLNS